MVIVGFNGAADSVPPLLWAAEEAARRGVPLRVLSAVNVQGVLTGPGGDQGLVAPEAVAEAEALLAEAAEHVSAVAGLTLESEVAYGSPAAILVEASETADLVVVGNRGRGELASVVLGSVAHAVTSHAHCPVVVVKGDGQWSVTAGHPVVVGVDGSEAGDRAVEFAAATAARSTSRLHLLSALREDDKGAYQTQPWELVTGPAVTAEKTEHASSLIEKLISAISARHPGLTITHEVIDGKPADALIEASKLAGLVVVGTRGRGGFKGLLLGSVSHGVIHEAACPVAVIR